MNIPGKNILLLILSLLVSASSLMAATEAQSFTAAEQVYSDADYKNAEADFSEFIKKYPNSPRIPEAVLFQAQSKIKLGDYDGALQLLSARQSQAGTLADWYLLCQGQALLAKGEFAQAEADFSKLIQNYPESPHRLAAVVNAAVARARLTKWSQVVELLGRTNGVFQQVASTNHANTDVIRGYLLLSEAQLAQNDTRAAESSLQYLLSSPLDATNNWQRQYLLCRVLMAASRFDDALQNTTNLLVLADATGQRSVLAQSTAFQAGLLEQMGRQTNALAVYQKNLGAGVPAERQREALLKITQLSLELGKIGDAAQVLQSFLAQFPTNDCSDLALLTLGELRLRQFQPGALTNVVVNVFTNASGPTNFLEQAIAAFRGFRTSYPRSPLIGKAQIDLGWCYLLGGNLADSQTAFQTAVTLLTPSAEQAQAYFKLADVQYQLTNYPAAISNYSAVVDRFPGLPEVRTNLAEPALYQMVRASQDAGDDAGETNALARIMDQYPDGLYTERAVLLAGQHMGTNFPSMARSLFCKAALTVSNSNLGAEIQLAIARTYEEESKWDDAIHQYDTWLATFTNNPAQGRAEYFRARANDEAGYETNALLQFTNLIARFPDSEFAPLARWWVGDYLIRANSFLEAESNYKFIFENTNWASTRIAYEARMMAGRAAWMRQGWETAKAYFIGLANDVNCPTDLRAQALFADGDVWLTQGSANKQADYREAFNAYDLVCKNYPTNALAALAWGQKAICQLQFASQDFASTSNAFQQVLDSSMANVTARSAAEVGLAVTLEKLADTRADPEKTELLNLALRHCQRVFYDEGFLRDGEKRDPFWTRKSGMEVARLAERLQRPDHAIHVYRRLQEMFPPLRFEDRIRSLQAQR